MSFDDAVYHAFRRDFPRLTALLAPILAEDQLRSVQLDFDCGEEELAVETIADLLMSRKARVPPEAVALIEQMARYGRFESNRILQEFRTFVAGADRRS